MSSKDHVIVVALENELQAQLIAARRSGDAYHEGYVDGIERAQLLVQAILRSTP